MGSTPQTIQSLLHSATPDIARLVGRARFLSRMRSALLEILPETAATRVHVADYEDRLLTLHVSDAAWATRLRFMEKEISRALAQRMRLQVDRVRVQVRPDRMQDIEPATRPRQMSHAARRQIERSAAYTEDPALAEALRRLAAAGRTE